MSNRKLTKALQHLFKQIWTLYRSLTKEFVTWLLRVALLPNRRRSPAAGFVLPTTVLLVLVVTLTSSALAYRAFNNSSRVIGNVQSKAIYNAATPAVDRARAKLDYMFNKDSGSIPRNFPEDTLIKVMRNEGFTRPDPYTLAGETRIDVNGDGVLDNSWIYTDSNSNNKIIYSINMATPKTGLGAYELLNMKESDKSKGDARGSFVRSAPLSNTKAVRCPGRTSSNVDQGWYEDGINTSILRKRFQVEALVANPDDAAKNRANFTTLEFSQDRQLDRGNKWGAWFRYDLEIHPGTAAPMNWNGAMHSEGNIIIGNSSFTSYLISAPASCVFLPESSSQVSVREFDKDQSGIANTKFQGIIAAGKLDSDAFGGDTAMHVYNGATYDAAPRLNTGTDWATNVKNMVSAIISDPLMILTQDLQQAREPDPNNIGARLINPPTEDNVFYGKRFLVEKGNTRPYLDDLYRADNRWGPKVQYSSTVDAAGQPRDRIPTGSKVGDPITGHDELTRDGSPDQEAGLDGYWERRTFANSSPDANDAPYTGGLRILVGERLQLGNPFGWVAPQDRPAAQQDPAAAPGAGDGTFDNVRDGNYAAITPATNLFNADSTRSDNPGDPLNPPYANTSPDGRNHEAKQRRALRDNLAAVQATAIYHYRQDGGAFPAACLLTTSHPGTPETLMDSVDFTQPTNNTFGSKTIDLRFDFFTGKGTNGWEFNMPQSAFDEPPMQQALQNLANLAGDPDGAFPPKQEAGKVHPDPALTMFGNFSNLRRALQTLPANRSPADWSYMHTAGCTLGALSYNINQIQQFDPGEANTALQTDLYDLGRQLWELMDGDPANGEVPGGGGSGASYNARSYDNATPDVFLAKLKEKLLAGTPANTQLEQIPTRYRLYRLAELIHESYQIRRDRAYGFRPSPAANTWNLNPYLTEYRYNDGGTNYGKPTAWSSACDPFMFRLPGETGATPRDRAQAANLVEESARIRLALSRLCGAVTNPGGVHDRFNADVVYPNRNGSGQEVRTNLPTSTADQAALDAAIAGVPPASPPPAYTTAGSPINTAPYTAEEFRYATVAPEFPVLYYLFPEFNHTQLGANDASGDHRQPGSPDINSWVAAFNPWREPYLDTASTINPAVQYQPVRADVSNPAALDYGAGTPPIAGAVFTSPQPGGAQVQITSFSYKAAQVFKTADLSTDLGVTPRALITGWTLPTRTVTGPNNDDTANPNLIRYGNPDHRRSTLAAVPFLDRVLFDGRQWLPNRVLDVDLNMLRSSAAPNSGDEAWLPVSGVVYAFREDARREDAIARPPGAAMDAVNIAQPTDPTLVDFGVSKKAIDYYPDPDRRDHGFRLRNGASLKRINVSVPADKNVRGLSFFSDNSVYILGNLNVHRTAEYPAGERLEEFTEKLPNDPGQYNEDTFYRNRVTPDTRFADRDQDFWRPTEILADSISILSKNFCDGSVIDTFTTAGDGSGNRTWQFPVPGPRSGADTDTIYRRKSDGQIRGTTIYNDQRLALFGPGCEVQNGQKVTSFLNQNRPSGDLEANPNQSTATNWLRENPADQFSPVKVSRNGNGLLVSGNTAANPNVSLRVPVEYSSANDPLRPSHNYMTLLDGDGNLDQSRPLQEPFGNRGDEDVTNINAILISGIVPSRSLQPYGGMHNFPRLLEYWQQKPLRIAGSFLQLNFSNYGTAPYDQEAWEPGQTPIEGDDLIDYFGFAPDRLWGYDVALLLAPASPAASRFTTPSSVRNEFYEEPKANDPYIKDLCTALKNQPNGIPTLNCPA